MTRDIPEIDDLTRGINDPEMTFSGGGQEASDVQESSETANDKYAQSIPLPDNMDKYWQDFLCCLENDGTKEDKTGRLVCKLDRDLADSLDDCDIHNRCRSDLVNAIVRAFFGAFLPRLAQYRREKKSLFTNFKGT